MRIPTTLVGVLLGTAALTGCGALEDDLPPAKAQPTPLWKQLPDKPPGPTPALPRGRRASFGVEQVAKGFTTPVQVVTRPGRTGTVYVVEQAGRILAVEARTGAVARRPVLDVRRETLAGGERGLLSALFHGGDLYVLLTAKPRGASRVIRFAGADATRREVLLEVAQPDDNHNGGGLAVGPDGRLYVGLGDGGGAFDTQDRAQDPASPFGKLLALDTTRAGARWQTSPSGCATRGGWPSTRAPATCGSATSARTAARRSTAFPPPGARRAAPEPGMAGARGRRADARPAPGPAAAPPRPAAVYHHAALLDQRRPRVPRASAATPRDATSSATSARGALWSACRRAPGDAARAGACRVRPSDGLGRLGACRRGPRTPPDPDDLAVGRSVRMPNVMATVQLDTTSKSYGSIPAVDAVAAWSRAS